MHKEITRWWTSISQTNYSFSIRTKNVLCPSPLLRAVTIRLFARLPAGRQELEKTTSIISKALHILMRRAAGRFMRIDANRSVDDVTSEIVEAILAIVKNGG